MTVRHMHRHVAMSCPPKGKAGIGPQPFFRSSFLKAKTMAGQKFAVGQFVEFDKSATPAFKPIGPYEVVRAQPADDPRLRAYRIKSKAEPFERSVKEYEILAIPPTPAESLVRRNEH